MHYNDLNGYMVFHRLFTLISTHKEDFSKVVVYVVADYVEHVHQHTLLPAVKVSSALCDVKITAIYFQSKNS